MCSVLVVRMQTFEIAIPHATLSAPERWRDITPEIQSQKASLALERTVQQDDHGGWARRVGLLRLWARRCRKDELMRCSAKDLLKVVLQEGIEKKWSQPFDVVTENVVTQAGKLTLAAASFTGYDHISDLQDYIRVWRVKGRNTLAHICFDTDSYNLYYGDELAEKDQLPAMIAECEGIVRSIEFKK